MISPETIERVRSSTSLVQVIGESVRLVRKGRTWSGLCPFHKEKTPSFYVSDERAFFRCYGCGASGDAIKFLQDHDGLAFRDAVKSLAERAGIPVIEIESGEEEPEREDLSKLYEANELAARFYESQLVSSPLSPAATEELAKRGIDTRSEVIKSFRIGYAPYGWGALSDHLSADMLPFAEAAGLVSKRKNGQGYYDRFRHRLMFSVFDSRGRVVAFSGRELRDPSASEFANAGVQAEEKRGEHNPKYLNSPESPVYKKRDTLFGLWQARGSVRSEGCVLVEGNFDVVSLHAIGITNVVAPLGTAFTPEQARLIGRLTGQVTLFFDGDRAGREATHKAYMPCRESGLLAKVVPVPDGKDPDDLSRTVGAPGIREMLSRSVGLIEHLINTEARLAQLAADAETKSAHMRKIRQLVDGEDDPVVRAIAEQCAYRASMVLAGQSNAKFKAFAAASSPTDKVSAPTKAEGTTHQSRIVGCLLDHPALLDDDEVSRMIEVLYGDAALASMEIRKSWNAAEGNQVAFADEVLRKVPKSLLADVSARLVYPEHERIEDARSELTINVVKISRAMRRSETLANLTGKS